MDIKDLIKNYLTKLEFTTSELDSVVINPISKNGTIYNLKGIEHGDYYVVTATINKQLNTFLFGDYGFVFYVKADKKDVINGLKEFNHELEQLNPKLTNLINNITNDYNHNLFMSVSGNYLSF